MNHDLIVADLIEMLECLPPDATVRIAYQENFTKAGVVANIATIPCRKGRPKGGAADGGYPLENEDTVVWLAVDDVPAAEHPYAPREAWMKGYTA